MPEMMLGWFVEGSSVVLDLGGGAGAVYEYSYMSLYNKGENVRHLPVATSASDPSRRVSMWFLVMLTWYLVNGR